MYSMKQSSTVTTSTRMLVAFGMAALGCGQAVVPSPVAIDETKAVPAAESEVDEPTIRVTISGAKSQQGVYSCAVFSNEADFMARSDAFESALLPIPKDTSKPATWNIPGMPPGTYTMAIFHDENENGKLDRHAFGYPTETYGFSNNARGKLGPPSYVDVCFEFADEDLEMQIQLK